MDLYCIASFPACLAESGDGRKITPIPLSAGKENPENHVDPV